MTNFIKNLRKNKGMSQEVLAERLNTTKATISKLEKGQIQLTHAWMVKIGIILGCQPWELISENISSTQAPPQRPIPDKQKKLTPGEFISFFEEQYYLLNPIGQQMVRGALLPLLTPTDEKKTGRAHTGISNGLPSPPQGKRIK